MMHFLRSMTGNGDIAIALTGQLSAHRWHFVQRLGLSSGRRSING
jgi:hypothetical protein